MAAPEVTSVYPADQDTGIPTGITAKVYFSTGVDLKTVQDSLVLFGNDFDVTSGPDQATWVNQRSGDNPFFLASPGFKGVMPLDIALHYYELGTTDLVTGGQYLSSADEIASNVGHVAYITLDPKYNSVLPANSELTLVINGDPENLNQGISRRTVFDIVTNPLNTGTGEISIYGTWRDNGSGNDTIIVEITKAGSIGTAEYKWWYQSNGSYSAKTGVLTSRRYRSLADGLQIKFSGTSFDVGDKFDFNVFHTERLAETTKVVFTTNDGSYTAAPESPSTPAESLPPDTVLPINDLALAVTRMLPEHTSYNVSVRNREIIIWFTESLDPLTVNDETIKLWKYPVDGTYDSTYSPVELKKTMVLEDNILTIRF